MKKLIIIFFINFSAFSQTSKHFYPKGLWFFGAEIGTNRITSFQPNIETSFQGGILAEYYISKKWSLTGRIKYYKTGLSLYYPAYQSPPHSGFDIFGWNTSYGNSEFSGRFEADVISVPINVRWNFKIYKNLKANINAGLAYNIETKSEYLNYSNNLKTDYPSKYFNLNSGIGFSYNLKNKAIVFIDFENFSDLKDDITTYSSNGASSKGIKTENSITNFGIKYNLKSKKQ